MRTPAALTDWHTVAEIRAALHAGQIIGGMTLELSAAHPELQDEVAAKKFFDYVRAYGLRIDLNRLQAPVAVYLRQSA